jgi:hypothetical protein
VPLNSVICNESNERMENLRLLVETTTDSLHDGGLPPLGRLCRKQTRVQCLYKKATSTATTTISSCAIIICRATIHELCPVAEPMRRTKEPCYCRETIESPLCLPLVVLAKTIEVTVVVLRRIYTRTSRLDHF